MRVASVSDVPDMSLDSNKCSSIIVVKGGEALMTTVSDFVSVGDVVAGSAAGARGRLWQLRPAEVRDVAVSASAEILRLEAIRVAAVDELALNPDEQVLCYRGAGRWLVPRCGCSRTLLPNSRPVISRSIMRQ